jgi:hypothetical protein
MLQSDHRLLPRCSPHPPPPRRQWRERLPRHPHGRPLMSTGEMVTVLEWSWRDTVPTI